MNLNAVDNLLYKGKNVLTHLLKPDVQIFAKGEILGTQEGNLQPLLQQRKCLFIPGCWVCKFNWTLKVTHLLLLCLKGS